MLNILIFSGTARQGNYTHTVAEFILQTLKKRPDITAEIVSPQSLGLQFENEANGAAYPELKQKVNAADGYVIVAPEYNHGYSGSLKFMIDLNLKEYNHKPAALAGVSVGPFAGARAIEGLLPVLRRVGLVATQIDLNVGSDIQEIKDGKFVDPAAWEAKVNKMLDELLWMTNALKVARATETAGQ